MKKSVVVALGLVLVAAVSYAVFPALKDVFVETPRWEKAKADNTIESLGSFLEQFPESKRKADAEKQIAVLRENRDWEEISQNPSADLVKKFIDQYPQSSHLVDAEGTLHAIGWANATPKNAQVFVQGVYMGGYQRFISEIGVIHTLSGGLGTAEVRYGINAGNGHFDMTRDGKKIARNGTNAKAYGNILAADSDGTETTTKIVGIIWSKEGNLLGSYLYSYDTHLGISNARQFEGLNAFPPLDPSKRLCAFKINPDATVSVQP